MSQGGSYQNWDPGRSLASILWYRWWRYVSWMIGAFFYDYRSYGRDRFPKTGPVLVIANHQSHFDPTMVGTVSERHMYFLARSTLFSQPIFRRFISSVNAIPIDQTRGDTTAIKTAIEHLRNGRCVVIFAEGSRTLDGGLQEFKPGAALLLRRAKVTILPVAIEGAFDIWPRWKSRPKWGGHIWVMVGRPITFEELMSHGTHSALDVLKDEIERMRMILRARLRKLTHGRYPAASAGDYRYDDPACPKRVFEGDANESDALPVGREKVVKA